MHKTMGAVVRDGNKIELLSDAPLPEGSRLLVMIFSEEEVLWLEASQATLKAVWDNDEDDIYARLLEK